MAPYHDTKYLQELVGEALARGCAAAVEAQPNDPVDYLGHWLLRFVKNAEIVGEYAREKEQQLAAKKAELEAQQEAAAKAKQEQDIRRAAVIELSKEVREPRELLQRAVELILQHTKAGAAYAAVVAEPEEADWTPPEDPEDPAAAESDDEPDPLPPGAEGAEGAEGGPAPADAAPAEGEEGAEEGDGPKIARPIDYSKKYLSYMAATPGQEFMLTTELHRPPPPPEDDPEAKAEPTPMTFRILDERRPMIYTPNVAFESAIRFFKNFPKIGAYQACGVQSPATGEFKAVIAADTLFPEAGGQALSQDDQDFIWHVSRALSQAYDAVEKQAAESIAGRSAKELVDSLKQKIHDIYFPPVDESAEAAAAGAGAGAPGTASATPEPPAAAGEGGAGEEGGDADPGDDPVALLRAEIKGLEEQLHAAETQREKDALALEVSQKVLAVIADTLLGVAGDVVPVLRHTRVVPQATFHVLKAVLHVLGKEPDTFKNWKRVYSYFSENLFREMHEFEATQERNLSHWKAARSCYKALSEDAVQRMEKELPDSHLGVLMLMWLKEVRKVGRRAAAFRAARDLEHSLHDQLDAKAVELVEAEKKKAEEEEEAHKAAEEAAAAEAAAAAEEEGGEGEGEE